VSAEGQSVARLYFARRATEAGDAVYLVRTLTLDHGLDEIGAERVAQVVHLYSVALLEGQQTATRAEVEAHLDAAPMLSATSDAPGEQPPAPVAAPPSPPAPTPSPRQATPDPDAGARRSVLTIHGGVGYGVAHRFDEGVHHGPRATLQAGATIPVRARLAVQGLLPVHRDLDVVGLGLYGASGSLSAELEAPVTSGATLQGFVGLGLDWIRYEARRASELPALVTEEAQTEARPIAVLGASTVLGAGAPKVALVATVAVALDDTRYDVTVGDATRVVARGPRVSPTLGAELWF
jgi:hypothetical protein